MFRALKARQVLQSTIKCISQKLKLLIFRIIVSILHQGPMPKHIAFIVDGNRRFAKKQKFAKVTDGHKEGSKNAYRILDAIDILGVPEITFYVFSIENFNRTKEEIEGIMRVIENAGEKTFKEIDIWKGKDVGFQVIGNYITAATPKARNFADKIMWATKTQKSCVLNIAFAYTGRNEISTCANTLLDGIAKNELAVNDLSDELFEETLSLRRMRPVDMLIRTGGDQRFSDFLLWESTNAYLEFVGVPWPEFSGLHFIAAIFRYQMQHVFKGLNSQRKIQDKHAKSKRMGCGEGVERTKTFLARRKDAAWNLIRLEALKDII